MPDNKMTNEEGLRQLATDWGYQDVEQMLEENIIDSVNLGICLECGYSADVEPDQDKGWCEECEKGSVVSCMMLAGII